LKPGKRGVKGPKKAAELLRSKSYLQAKRKLKKRNYKRGKSRLGARSGRAEKAIIVINPKKG